MIDKREDENTTVPLEQLVNVETYPATPKSVIGKFVKWKKFESSDVGIPTQNF